MSLAEIYYVRDKDSNNPQEIILNNMIKLGYYNINKTKIYKLYIKQYLIKLIKNDKLDYTKSFEFYINEYKKQDEYKLFMNEIDRKISRCLILSKYLDTNKIKEFYNDCLEDELLYLGY
jgi:hypothetical protein